MFLPDGAIRNIEGPMWDYKVGFCLPKAELHPEPVLTCELMHDIAALYNAFGGYLVIAFKEENADHFKRLWNKDDFDKLTDRYFKTYIPIAPLLCDRTIGGDKAKLLLLHVAKRSIGPPIAYKRNSAARSDQSLVFRLDDIPLRYGSSTLVINQRHDLLVFAFGDRKADIGEMPGPLNEVDNNLPARDPNLIEFIGRREYLVQLWNWLADTRNPVKILTALGGTGKTAIAYEFCEQVVKTRSEAFAKVIWLTAKSQTYAAILQKYVSTTRTDFTDIDTFLDAFLSEIGCLTSDFEQFENLEDKLDFAKELIKDVPVLLVIDDLDSLDPDKQIELYSRIAQLFDQGLSKTTQAESCLRRVSSQAPVQTGY
ncbi:ATP-binding protein [Tardiphaga alba]|uniref:ATP-binding protein n=1 Tax=Tardiphaga alba TaxID=340268 RepID=A0ABX8A895_9BRAD|nr:ATP-binding protein [Tardiphaga alba]QUS38635.1 ATP-binding protein [Tardiphaga alba]